MTWLEQVLTDGLACSPLKGVLFWRWDGVTAAVQDSAVGDNALNVATSSDVFQVTSLVMIGCNVHHLLACKCLSDSVSLRKQGTTQPRMSGAVVFTCNHAAAELHNQPAASYQAFLQPPGSDWAASSWMHSHGPRHSVSCLHQQRQ